MTPESLTRTVQDFLSEASGAIVLENGAVMFDLAQSKYSISGEHNKCLLHLWSAERNTVRRVLDAEVKSGTLRLSVQRLGQSHPTKVEICRERDRRSPSAKRAARAAYENKLRRAIERHFPGFSIARLTSGVDLEKSFGVVEAPQVCELRREICLFISRSNHDRDGWCDGVAANGQCFEARIEPEPDRVAEVGIRSEGK